jgi:hypothetical protein
MHPVARVSTNISRNLFAFVVYHGNAINKPLLSNGRLPNISCERFRHHPRGDGCSDVETCGEADVVTGACTLYSWRRRCGSW